MSILVSYLPNARVKMEPVSYSPQWGSQNVNLGAAGYGPTSNPLPEPERSWQPHLPTHQAQRPPHQQQHPGLMQPVPGPWSRNDSDSEYDSGYGLDQDPVGMRHPVGAHPDHMQNFYTNNPHQMDRNAMHRGRQGKHSSLTQLPCTNFGVEVMWQHHPSGPTSNAQFEGPPHIGTRDDTNTYGTNTPFVSEPSTPGWSPHIQTSERDAYF